ncbi:MAG TPA: glycosyltransferase family 2 protein [Ktedonobacteraceae bacterium]|nr:glycosyltransferase family 2 protein [Ktedonobacteraceae bacterium]
MLQEYTHIFGSTLLHSVIVWLLLGAETCIAAPILYVCILSITAILVTKKREIEKAKEKFASAASQYNFAILVPAHNEEDMLGNLLRSLSALAYPQNQYTIYVVADNCTDTTAEVARGFDGVRVYERFDMVKRGKGYALGWVFQKLEEAHLIHDAYVILDADSQVEPTFLQWMAKELAQGAQALQARYNVLNIAESPSTALRGIALTLNNHMRPLSRSSLGGSSTLTGNGMCFSRSLLERCPWQAFALSEDYQYYLTLVEHGERVHYVPEAVVCAHMPTTFAAMRTQDIRWEAPGDGPTLWQVTLGLLKAGMQLRSFVCFEAIVELLTPPLSLLASCCLVILIAALLLQSPLALLCSLVLIGGLVFYIGTGFYLLRPPLSIYKALLYAPGFMVWKLWVYFVLARSKKHTSTWVRTSRS